MSKALKTGDVKRYPRRKEANYMVWQHLVDDGDKWVVIYENGSAEGWESRAKARRDKRRFGGIRIARILSITPKLVTVRIEK